MVEKEGFFTRIVIFVKEQLFVNLGKCSYTDIIFLYIVDKNFDIVCDLTMFML